MALDDDLDIIDLEKMSKPAAIKLVMTLMRCSRQQAEEFVAVVRKETSGDVIDEKEPGTRRTKEAGSGQEAGQLLEDGEDDAGSGNDDAPAGYGHEARGDAGAHGEEEDDD